jgi:hypothetical protein
VQEQSASVGFSDDKQGDTVKTQYKSTKSRKTNK